MILIVGGAGYLGSHISTLLGNRCLVYDNLTYRDEFLNDTPFIMGDVTDHDKLKYWLDQVDCVIWLAAIVGDAACMLNPGLAREVNVNAVEFLASSFTGPIIFTSTASVYGINEGRSTEESELNPQSLYAETKVEAEKILAKSNALILRLGTLHGLSDRMRFDLVVNVMTRDAVMGGRISVFGGGQQRPLLSVLDAAMYIRKWTAGEWEPGVYNLASQNRSIDTVSRTIRDIVHAKIVSLESEYEDRRDYSLNCDKAMEVLDVPVTMPYGIGTSVSGIAKALRSGRIKDPYHAKYVNAKVMAMWR